MPCRKLFRTMMCCGLLLAGEAAMGQNEQTCLLEDLDLAKMSIGWGSVQAGRSVDGNPLTIAGRVFPRGVGTHASSSMHIDLHGTAQVFHAWVGIDDEIAGAPAASVEFRVYADGIGAWRSGIMRAGQPAQQIRLDVSGVRRLILAVRPGSDGINYDHADWADAKFTYRGKRPVAVTPAVEPAVILTPRPPVTPRINGPRVFGVRPGSPLLFTIAATGARPMTFAAEDLPPGVTLDGATGRLRGTIAKAGTYRLRLSARNEHGAAERTLRVEVGERIALTPPMGWNSWNCFAHAVTADKIRAAADAMVSSGLANHGWSYINIDDFWQVCPDHEDTTLHGPGRAADGTIVPNPRFPDMAGLADYVHERGLKIGLYSSPGPRTCGGCLGSEGHEERDAATYAAWGFDYLTYDLCSYMHGMRDTADRAENIAPYRTMQAALRAQRRDIVYSLCQYGLADVSQWGGQVDGNCWRTTGDIVDTWGSMSGIGFSQAGLERYAEPGRWNDPDMLVVGQVGWGPDLHPTRLTPNEQYTHISLWSLLAAPLLLGCDLTALDEFTRSLLTNDEVLAVNQDPLGRQASRLRRDDVREVEVWARPLEDGTQAVGLFNLGEAAAEVEVFWSELGRSGRQTVRDLWRQKDLGAFERSFRASVPRHGVVLVRIGTPREQAETDRAKE